MCIKLSKTLNPKALEWRPPMQKHPHPIAAPLPPPQQAAPPPFNPTPPHKLFYYYPNPPPTYQSLIAYNYHNVNTHRHPFYCVSSPPTFEMAATGSKSGNEMNVGEENVNSYKEKKMDSPRGKIPKCPRVDDVVWKGYCGRVFPPRLERRFGADYNTASSKKEWRPRRSVNKADCKVSGDGGAARSPSADGCVSRCKNTTVMIKNIPNQLRRDFMLKFLDDYCKEHYLEYDFLYLPMDFRKKDNLGYAFVNFTTAVAALKFKKILQNYKWGMVYDEGRIFTSKKICDITWARIQGKKALIERFHNSSFACDKLEFLPVVLDPPRNGSDPNPSPPVIIGTLHRQALKKID